MTEAKYTPGPWRWSAGWAMGPDDNDGTSCVQSDAGDLVFYSCDGCSLGVSFADAALIAAAPDLLKALKGLLTHEPPLMSKKEQQAYIVAKAAIAKAEVGA